MEYSHVDVFTQKAYGGNSLTVFLNASGLTAQDRLSITREMRHFESIFLQPTSDSLTWRAHVAALDGELPIAGHPLLGAAAVLHCRQREVRSQSWKFALEHRDVTVATQSTTNGVLATLELDWPSMNKILDREETEAMLRAFRLQAHHAHPWLMPQVVDVGLRYLVIPLANGLQQAAICVSDLTQRLEQVGAELAYLLEIQDTTGARLAARHWTNDGSVEDVATGSGAAAATAFLATHQIVNSNQWHILQQGEFAGRPSEIRIRAVARAGQVQNVLIAGSVVAIGEGRLLSLPNSNPPDVASYE